MIYGFCLNESCKKMNMFGEIIFEAPDIKYEQLDKGDYDE